MSNLSNNYIAGDWVKGASSISNINPSIQMMSLENLLKLAVLN